MTAPTTLTDAACAVLAAAAPDDKVALTKAAAEAWHAGAMTSLGTTRPPARPARPARPELRAPRDMPRRKFTGGDKARVAMVHALAHIELNAVDLAWDLIARFAGEAPVPDFFDDWVKVADEEALHFTLLCDRLADFDAAYGDLPAHDGLWQAAEATAGDLLARLAVVPMVLEARGLDVTPKMIANLQKVGDHESAAVLDRIYQDEIGHVRIGNHWFTKLCDDRDLAADQIWRSLVESYFAGIVKPPFNTQARSAAGFEPSWYQDLAAAN